MSVLHVTKNNFEEEVLNSKGIVLVDFFATWCGPCKMLSPVIEELATEIPNVKFVKVNVDEQPELATKHNIMSIPTLLVFKEGKLINHSVGFKNKQAIKQMIL